MPTVLTLDGVRLSIFLNDHRPAHVHAFAASSAAVLILHCPTGPVRLKSNHGFKLGELRRLIEATQKHVGMLCIAWEGIHEA